MYYFVPLRLLTVHSDDLFARQDEQARQREHSIGRTSRKATAADFGIQTGGRRSGRHHGREFADDYLYVDSPSKRTRPLTCLIAMPAALDGTTLLRERNSEFSSRELDFEAISEYAACVQ